MAQALYALSPQNQNGSRDPQHYRGHQPPFFSVAQAISNLSSTANNFTTPSGSANPGQIQAGSTPAFVAPAHKHAHHLHSIPPREKSTRTLIIDHMLWVHGRTRFSQARAELGMTERTGGPSSTNYVHRLRPENYEEDDEETSDGEDVRSLGARQSVQGNEEEEEQSSKQDYALARGLRLRAEGVEKVVTSMLDQPPPIHPVLDDEFQDTATSPKQNPQTSQGDATHPHTLPNGVRLRLYLGTVINDLFARQTPHPPHRQQSETSRSPATDSSSSNSCPKLSVYSTISAFSIPLLNTSQDPLAAPKSRIQAHAHSPNSRTQSLYLAGVDPSTSISPPSFRCPRHLYTGCEICVEAKETRMSSSQKRGRRSSATNAHDPGSHDQTTEHRDQRQMSTSGGVALTGWQEGSGIGSGLLRPSANGTVLRRQFSSANSRRRGLGDGNVKLAELIPRFIRLSALVAIELGIEAKEEVIEKEDERRRRLAEAQSFLGQEGSWQQERRPRSTSISITRAGGNVPSLGPTNEWYMLLAGLLTRAVLEGYLSGGWKGVEPAECLLAVGLDICENEVISLDDPSFGVEDHPDDLYDELEPDGLPNLKDAARVLFPNLPAAGGSGHFGGDTAEGLYEIEMSERLKRFCDIPASTPDLSTHMEDMAWRYPAEPIERAALRFCEAVAKWRGKPEIETYKKRPPGSHHSDTPSTPGGSAMTLESLVHSNPCSPIVASSTPAIASSAAKPKKDKERAAPSIALYFSAVAKSHDSLNQTKGIDHSLKRRHEDGEADGGSDAKKVHS